MMNELVTHIQNLNAKTQAWVNEDPKNRFAGMLVDEPEHWARYDVHTVAQFEHYMAATELYEATKSKYGYKPDRGIRSGCSVSRSYHWRGLLLRYSRQHNWHA